MVRHDGRGSTHPGQPATVPASVYEPPPEVVSTAIGLTVAFDGEDGRSKVFTVGELPLPGWHPALAPAFAQRVGPTGSRRTLASAASSWTVLGRLVRFLGGLPHPPAIPAELTAAQVDAYMRHRVRVVGPWAWEELSDVRLLLRQPPLREQLGPAVLNYLSRRVDKRRNKLPGRSGYSDGELARVVDAARAEVDAEDEQHIEQSGPRVAHRALPAALDRYNRGKLTADHVATWMSDAGLHVTTSAEEHQGHMPTERYLDMVRDRYFVPADQVHRHRTRYRHPPHPASASGQLDWGSLMVLSSSSAFAKEVDQRSPGARDLHPAWITSASSPTFARHGDLVRLPATGQNVVTLWRSRHTEPLHRSGSSQTHGDTEGTYGHQCHNKLA